MDNKNRFLSSLARNSSGNALAIFAAALVPMTIMVGSGLEVGVTYMARAKLQNACDAGALAGRQAMEGNAWNDSAKAEAEKFFDFNFPLGTHGVTDAAFEISQDRSDRAQIVGEASGTVPTVIMDIFGYEGLGIAVSCNAKRDLGHNDVMLVLDVTGSMLQAPSNGSGTKIERLRAGAAGLYRALDDAENGSVTRFGIMPYSHTVNVARHLADTDILTRQTYNGAYRYRYCDVYRQNGNYYRGDCEYRYSQNQPSTGFSQNNTKYTDEVQYSNNFTREVDIRQSSWGDGSSIGDSKSRYRNSGQGCIEERPTFGNAGSPVRYEDAVVRSDIDARAVFDDDTPFQFGRYDPARQMGESQSGCPNEARKLQVYSSQSAYQSAINATTANPTGGTYHDIGMLWGARFLSRTGWFRNENPTAINEIPVNQHIVFMTDGMLDTGDTLYSSHGVERHQGRTNGAGSLNDRHLSRFDDICSVVKSTGVTVWVIALDVTDTEDVRSCATSAAHFYTSDGSDLEKIFETIGQGIGNLRLTR